MKTVKAILFATILSLLILGCETVKESPAPSAAPIVDPAIIGEWGLSPAMVRHRKYATTSMLTVIHGDHKITWFKIGFML